MPTLKECRAEDSPTFTFEYQVQILNVEAVILIRDKIKSGLFGNGNLAQISDKIWWPHKVLERTHDSSEVLSW